MGAAVGEQRENLTTPLSDPGLCRRCTQWRPSWPTSFKGHAWDWGLASWAGVPLQGPKPGFWDLTWVPDLSASIPEIKGQEPLTPSSRGWKGEMSQDTALGPCCLFTVQIRHLGMAMLCFIGEKNAFSVRSPAGSLLSGLQAPRQSMKL